MLLATLLTQVSLAANYYVSTTGSDSNNGTSVATSFLTLGKAITVAVANDVIFLASGTYVNGSTINITKSNITIKGVFTSQDLRPVLDFSGMALADANYGIQLKGSNCYFYGFMIKGAGDNGLLINAGTNNTVEFCNFFENRDSGVQLKTGAKLNRFINCDSYYNVDALQGNADGFANKLDEAGFNSFRGCRAYQNSDDGWDGLPKDQTYLPSDTIINCWCYKNGYLKDGSASQGNGNGFKLGGNSLIHDQTVMNCLSALNRAKGFDYNNNVGSMVLYNCTGYGNGGIGNFAFPNAVATDKELILKNCLSFDPAYGKINAAAVQATNSWMSPFTVSAADFISTDAAQMLLPRKEDGSLPDITFMHLKAGSDLIDAGTEVGLPFAGTKPDLGCFEYNLVTSDKTNSPEFSDFMVYPNPAKGNLYFRNAAEESTLVKIYDSSGILIQEKTLEVNETAATISISALNPGMYLVEAIFHGNVIRRKVLVE